MESIASLRRQAFSQLAHVQNEADLRAFELAYVGRKKGKLTQLLRSIGSLPRNKRSKIGIEAHRFQQDLHERIAKQKQRVHKQAVHERLGKERIDISFPGTRKLHGHIHPLTKIRQEAEGIFSALGFVIAEGPEVETEYYNFDALNIPADHPARDLWDTFWIKEHTAPRVSRLEERRKQAAERLLLRTHTSPVQIRYMEVHEPPIRIIAPGKVFRYEATDASHETEFLQIEGLLVDKQVSVAHLKYVLEIFFQKMFSEKVMIRLRPSYFPFVEPGFEIDMKMPGGKWMEMLGAGMVHQQVFKKVGYIPGHWKGFAFGIGLDRVAMMKYRIPDIRLIRSGDMRFLKQF